jgi:hypothetical protein
MLVLKCVGPRKDTEDLAHNDSHDGGNSRTADTIGNYLSVLLYSTSC